MADSIITKQELIDAQKDAQTLEEVISGEPGKLVETRLGRKVYTLASVPQINTMTREEVTEIAEAKANSVDVYQKTETYTKSEIDSAVAPKADQQYVDNALTGFTNGAAKFYPTIAAAQADIANISVKEKVEVGEAEFGGIWYKATAGSTYLTKSTYDPLTQAKTDATTKANAAEANAKGYADAKKLDYSQIEVAYRDGNLIGANTERHLNLGVTSARAISATSFYDSIIVRVNAGDTVYLFNDSNAFSNANGSNYAFFANNPFVDQTQINVAHTFTAMTDTTSSINYNVVKVPSGANYLLLNSRRTTSGGTRYDYQWAVHKDVFRASYVAGREYVARIAGTQVRDTDIFTAAEYRRSTKNLYRGKIQTKARLVGTVVQITTSDNDVISPYIPVEYGKSYTISGLQPAGLRDIYTLVHGTSADFAQSHVKTLATSFSTGVVTVTIDDPAIKYIVFSLTGAENSSYQQAKEMLVQVEEGLVATKYEPNVTSDITNTLLQLIGAGTGGSTPSPSLASTKIVSQFTQLDKVRDPTYTSLAPVGKDVGPLGITYSLKSTEDSAANNLYAKHDVTETAKKAIYMHVMKFVNDVRTVGVLSPTPFTVPSGSLDNPDSFADVSKYPNYMTVHPSMAYTDTAINGFKYWMVSSTFPPTSQGGVLWEDEDLFVSNDAKNWQRVRSMYETDKSYTTSALRLPPQNIVTTGARKNAFLPSPVVDSVFEVSFPANNGQLAVERQNFTVGNGLPWKHDPYLLIDGGYVYVYHSFNLFFKEGGAKKSHFFVCVRTSNGIDWDFVRSDGSTLRITEETSKQVFTKGADGKYNYLSYAYDNSRSNPEVIKFGANDYTLFYGRNFTEKFQSTTPYGFDFSSGTVVKDLGNMNHPTLTVQGGVLYNISNYWVHSSTDRGATWIKLPNYPMWRGGVSGFNYRKSSCVGEGGKFIVADVTRNIAPAFTVDSRSVTSDVNTMQFYEYPDFSDFLAKANIGLIDAYADLQIAKVNLVTKTRTLINIPAVSLRNSSISGNNVLQPIKVAELDMVAGDTIHFNVTLNSRNNAQINFGGIEIL